VYSVNGKILHVDLSTEKIWVEKYSEDVLNHYIGSRGILAKLYWDLVPPNIDPLSSKNVVMIGTGTFTGTPMPSAGRTTVVFKSPSTGRYFKSSVGGDFGLKLKLNGYDILVIHGKSETPVYIYIENENVQIKPAMDLWGLDVRTVHTKLMHKYGLEIDTILIGPAGEKLVKYASINASVYNVAARGGGGAVLGSKMLKGIVVSKGTNTIEVANPSEYQKLYMKVVNNIMNDEALIATSKFGTASATMGLDSNSMLPTYNFKQSFWEHAYKNSGEYLVEAGYLVSRVGCAQCIVSCHRHTKTSKYGGVDTVGPEYETLNSFGANLGITDTDAIIYMNDLANIYGMDTISLGGVISWVIESYEKGYLQEIKEELGIEPRWGDIDFAIKLIELIKSREGIGDLLAEGLAAACKKVNPETCKWAIQENGLEHSRVDTRVAKAYALAFALNPRGPDHLHTETFAEFGFSEGALKLVERITGHKEWAGVGKTEGRPEIVRWHEDMYAVTDSVGFCAFITTAGFAVDEYLMGDLFTAATGLPKTGDTIMKDGERIVTLERMIVAREGRRRKHDKLPWRIMNEPVKTREGKEYIVSKEELDSMLDRYFEIRKWDKELGIPLPDKLKELGLDFTIPLALEILKEKQENKH